MDAQRDYFIFIFSPDILQRFKGIDYSLSLPPLAPRSVLRTLKSIKIQSPFTRLRLETKAMDLRVGRLLKIEGFFFWFFFFTK